ncbi:MAG TPA: UDP-N-acetylmuramoyl-L-alanyl-D-glutamate--2,6-diaminopimelate ligase [Bryobacteraceae bacterium]|jgi:UDP-N-acetylmuramoyl-L-alanyl-D-glutamate--2,6-diaminopimelate ligase|nr:UDP-N-acetylmuramoyl-L-alanyl-D-glutamate--2,6-diaminopimelate ligase [Bryobacteraceae bacterium]
MNLGEILSGVRLKRPLSHELAAVDIAGLDYDSRRVTTGFLFFAFPGSRTDGRQFASDALARGASAVASESPMPEGFPRPWIEVEHGRQALSLAARNFYGRPDERLRLTGITGTNGKTTTGYLVDAVLRAAGHTTALVGTIEYHLAGKVLPAVNTTPESLDLVRMFAELETLGGTHVTMEVSSHALALRRVYGLHFHTAVFSNLTRDHLDFHGTMEAYLAAKQTLFEGAGGPPPRAAVVNRDDQSLRALKLHPQTETYWYGLGPEANLRARHISSGFDGLRFDVQYGKSSFGVGSPLIGKTNVYNILAACGAALSYGIPPETIARGIGRLQAVPGRFERVDEGQPFVVVVDYAHTDDALRNVIAVARGLNPNRVITLFGCGGDRDRTKRPLMGQAAAEASDFVVLTSDNPRSEDPLAIMNDALVGIRRADVPHVVEPDRAAAIARALKEAREGDIVLLAGKGHESYQILKDKTIAFDDREVAREVLRGYGYHKTR